MIPIYRPTSNTSSVEQFTVSRFNREYEFAVLGLPIIREVGNERGRITRPQLLHRLREQHGNFGVSVDTINYTWTLASRAIVQQGLVTKTEETLSIYLTKGRITELQIGNYGTWMSDSGIFIAHTKKNRGLYSQEEEDVWGKIADYMDNELPVDDRMPAVEAVKTAVGEVLGQEKAAQFYVGYKVKNRSINFERYRKKRAELLQEDPSKSFGSVDYDVFMRLYTRIGSKVPLEIRSRVLDKLVHDYFKQHFEAMENYPFDLYFALSANEPEAVLRVKFDSLMKSTPTQAKFDDYGSTLYSSFRRSLEPVSARLVEYFDRGFEESEDRTLEDQIDDLHGLIRTERQISTMKRNLEIVRARYKDSGTLRTLEEIGRDKGGVSREAIRQSEGKGIGHLREQPTIQELLALDFWEI